jgi:hypothetical protein
VLDAPDTKCRSTAGSNDQEEGLLFTREKPFHFARIDFVLAVEAME